VEPFGLLDRLPAGVLEQAREWERHVVEVETGLPPDPPPGPVPRPGHDPAITTMLQQDQAKAAELWVSLRTVQIRRSRYAPRRRPGTGALRARPRRLRCFYARTTRTRRRGPRR